MITKKSVLELIDEYISENYDDLQDGAYDAVSEVRELIVDIQEES